MFSPLSRLVGCLGEGQGMGQETTHSIEVQIRTKGADPGFVFITSLHCLNCRVALHFRNYFMILLLTSDFLIPCGPCCNLRSTAKALITIPHSRLEQRRGPGLFC